MAILVGTDEAGYGPNLGPLTVGGSVWKCAASDVDLYRCLRRVIRSTRTEGCAHVADSKAVYQGAGKLRHLERNTLCFVGLVHGRLPADWSELAVMLGFDEALRHAFDAFQSHDLTLPIESDGVEIGRLIESLETELERNEVELVALRVRAIFPKDFNAGLRRYGNKASFLSATTLEWVARLLDGCEADDHDVLVGCDKHGGRSRYGGLVQQFLTDQLVVAICEGRDASAYRWTDGESRREIRFTARGESFLPTALASMVAKYVRQLAMLAWNRFWSQRVSDLQPTQGYPVDAARFKQQIQPVLKELKIADHEFWRER